MEVGGEGDYYLKKRKEKKKAVATPAVTTGMTSALRMKTILMFHNCEGQCPRMLADIILLGTS